MDSLRTLTSNNLTILKELQEHEIITCNRKTLKKHNDNENLSDLEYGIYFTFHQLFLSIKKKSWKERDNVIKDINICINNIYNNEHLNKCMDNEDFYSIIKEIDIKNDLIKESIGYNSPFYKSIIYISTLFDGIVDIYRNKHFILFLATYCKLPTTEYEEYSEHLDHEEEEEEEEEEEVEEVEEEEVEEEEEEEEVEEEEEDQKEDVVEDKEDVVEDKEDVEDEKDVVEDKEDVVEDEKDVVEDEKDVVEDKEDVVEDKEEDKDKVEKEDKVYREYASSGINLADWLWATKEKDS